MVDRRELKERLIQERMFCEGQRIVPHDCAGGLELHEALIKRNDCAGAYAFDERNCLLLCSWFHAQHGQARSTRQRAYEMLSDRYGQQAIDDYLENVPLKGRL